MADTPADGLPGAAIAPPIEPMLAKLAEALPEIGAFLFEPKWDGFRALVFRGSDDVYIQSRDLRPLDRYFPELHAMLLAALPPGCTSRASTIIPPWSKARSERIRRSSAGGTESSNTAASEAFSETKMAWLAR